MQVCTQFSWFDDHSIYFKVFFFSLKFLSSKVLNTILLLGVFLAIFFGVKIELQQTLERRTILYGKTKTSQTW